jgi:hypothetical protein
MINHTLRLVARFAAPLVLFIGLSAACGKKDDGLEAKAVPLTAPWTEWKLPLIDGAKVVESTPQKLAVLIKGNKGGDLMSIFAAHLQKNGWASDRPVEADDQSAVFTKDGKRVHLAYTDMMEQGVELILEFQ